ncbi:sigma 54-interacting transcriptional regulator [Clostridiaceae bacterium 35-E11]
MISLEPVKPTLQKIIAGIGDAIKVDVAVFDRQCQLLISTQDYLEQKGKTVHTPSIEEVLSHGNVLVNKPGYMKSCMGCRFKNNCPSTIELLNCIKLENHPIGVLALTSFTKEGHQRLTKNITMYIEILNEISDLISSIALQKCSKDEFVNLNRMLQTCIDFSNDSFVTIDSKGVVTHCNAPALKLFSFCDLYTKSIYQILPDTIIHEILSGGTFSNKPVKTDTSSAFISCVPVKNDNEFVGAVIRIRDNHSSTFSKKKITESTPKFSLDSMKGKSEVIQNLKETIHKIADSSSSVLVTGETGTGKELVAKTIHYNSCRKDFPFVAINCASIPETLFESELFGYEEGAFTGARKGGKPGKFELAQGGTFFLDEIGEMPLHMQSKLLRVLQEYTIERVGSTRSIPIDVRIIAATNQNLEEMVAQKEFRADLYYRLNVIPLTLSPLRTRRIDIEILAMEFLKRYATKLNKPILCFSDEAMNLLQHYSWPGNVRELENVVEYAVNMTAENMITLDSLPKKILLCKQTANAKIKKKVKNVEMDMIQAALNKHGWDVKGKTAAAKELGMGLRTLYRKIKNFEESTKDN